MPPTATWALGGGLPGTHGADDRAGIVHAPASGGTTMPALFDRLRRDTSDAVSDAADLASAAGDAACSAGSTGADTAADPAGALVACIGELAEAMRERLGDAVDAAGDVGRTT